jgi:hypothetical protein
MTRVVKGIAAVLLLLTTLGLHADAPPGVATVETLLKEVVTGLYDAISEHRLEQAMRFYHSNSPEIARARAEIELSQAAYLQKTQTLSFAYTGRREDLALGTATHRFLRIAGVKFFENFAEISYVFRKEGEAWKLWTSRVH